MASMGTGGQQTCCPLQERLHKWTHLYAFVHPQKSGELYWLILPTVNTELFSMALNEFAKVV